MGVAVEVTWFISHKQTVRSNRLPMISCMACESILYYCAWASLDVTRNSVIKWNFSFWCVDIRRNEAYHMMIWIGLSSRLSNRDVGRNTETGRTKIQFVYLHYLLSTKYLVWHWRESTYCSMYLTLGKIKLTTREVQVPLEFAHSSPSSVLYFRGTM